MKQNLLLWAVIGIVSGTSGAAWAQSDRKIRPGASLGIEIPVGKELSHVYDGGVVFDIQLPVRIYRGLHVGPVFSLSRISKNINEGAKETYFNTGIGLAIEYELPLFDEFKLIAGVRGMHGSSRDKISPRNGYTGDRLEVFDGKGTSAGISAGVEYNHFVLTAIFSYRKYDVIYGSQITQQFEKYNGIYEIFQVRENYRMNFSTVSISLAYRL